MACADVQMFMDKLRHLISCNDENPKITCERPQFQLLYDELGSMIQTLFIDQHQDLEKLNDLKKRFADAAEEAQYIVDLFLSGVHNGHKEHFLASEDFNSTLNIDDVWRSLNSVKVDIMSMRIDSMKMDLSQRPERTLNQSAAAQTSISRDSLASNKLSDEIVVGLDRDAELIRDKLVEDQKKLDVVSIVGMGGIGKTSLAQKVFNDGYVKHHFYVRVWVTVSQTYDKRAVLIQILESIRGQLNLEKASDSRLREMVHKHLMGKRYLIVIDDIWHIETWDNLKLFFPHDNNGSRILLTSRLFEVAKHAKSDGLIHHLGYLNKEKSWELLCQKVFHGNEFPEWSIKPGMQIVEHCRGLPLAVVVIAGVLAKEAWSQKLWLEIAQRMSSYIISEQNGCLETLGLSYNHLPLHLRECFLYLGGFPEDYKIRVRRLIWLWVAEGFIQQDGNRSLEDIAEGYLMDLIDRNLVIVADMRNSVEGVKAFKLHDLVRELCLRKAKEEQFTLQTEMPISYSQLPPYKPVRMFINISDPLAGHSSTQNLRSILSFSDFRGVNQFFSFVLLRVLDLQHCVLNGLPCGIESLVHLRYLAVQSLSDTFPSSICNLRNLRTLIYTLDILARLDRIILPRNISNLVNLRHLWSYGKGFVLPTIEKPMNLQSISHVELVDGVDNFQKCFPYVKELRCSTHLDGLNDFTSLTYLEKLTIFYRGRRREIWYDSPKGEPKYCMRFPATLKTLTLCGCLLPWSDMSIIHLLPNLNVLKLEEYAFKGSCWNTDEQEFRQLKFLRLGMLDIKQWEAYSTSFPCLKRLEIFNCLYLEEIPLEIGDIPTLELIQISYSSRSANQSVRRIQEEQNDLGNYNLKIHVVVDDECESEE